MRNWNKVFEVGSPKTGTTSLGGAFRLLGLRHMGWAPALFDQLKQALAIETGMDAHAVPENEWDARVKDAWAAGTIDPIIRACEDFDSFADGPWHVRGLYKVFDVVYPNSKFILLERDLESWLRSHEAHFSEETGKNRIKKKYRISDWAGEKERIAENHRRKYEEVKAYFGNRPGDLLVMDVTQKDAWSRLCGFLGMEVPAEPFPHLNKSGGK